LTDGLNFGLQATDQQLAKLPVPMRKKRGDIQVFSVSFLDVLSCALGGVLLLLLAKMNERDDEGFVVPIALVFRIDWNEKADMDLWVKDPDTTQSSTKFVYYENPRSRIGSLMRDVQSERVEQWEAYFTLDPHPGVYEVYAHYFDEDFNAPVPVTFQAVLFPGDPTREIRIEAPAPVTLRRDSDGSAPGRLLGRFEIVQFGDDYELRQLSP